MQFLASVVLLAGLTSTYAAPANLGPTQEFQAEVQKAVEPIQAQVRALVDNAKFAAEDMAKGLSESSGNVLEAGRNLLTPSEDMDRANLGGELVQRVLNFGKQVQTDARSLVGRAGKDANPIIANERSAIFGVNDAVDMLQKKYLTSDGQDLAKLLSRAAGRAGQIGA